MTRRRTGGGIDYAGKYRWRYQFADGIGWTFALTLRDIRDDVADRGVSATVQRRTGRRGDYTYEHHSVVTP